MSTEAGSLVRMINWEADARKMAQLPRPPMVQLLCHAEEQQKCEKFEIGPFGMRSFGQVSSEKVIDEDLQIY